MDISTVRKWNKAVSTLKNEVNKSSKRNVFQDSRRKRNSIKIKSETEYSQPTSQQSVTPSTKEVGTESSVDVDHVHTICEIYSLNELPACFQPNARTQPKHGDIIPEYHEGQCIILRAYRCKGVNTIEKPEYNNQQSNCTYISCLDEQALDELRKSSGQKFEGENVCTFSLLGIVPVKLGNIPIRIAGTARCKATCPNLLATQDIQTVDESKYKKPEEQDDDSRGTPPTVCRTQQSLNASEDRASLTTIEEYEEEYEGPSVAEKSVGPDKRPRKYQRSAGASASGSAATPKSVAAKETDALPMYADAERRLRQTKSNLCNVASLLETNLIRECRVICSRSNFCCEPTQLNSYTSRTNIVQPLMNLCTLQRNALRSNTKLSYRGSERQISSGPYECLSDRCFDRKNHLYRVESNSSSNQHELCASNGWPSKSRRSFSPVQESFTNQHNGINNTHGNSIAGGRFENCTPNRWYRDNTYRPCYLNFNRTYNPFGRHCPCNNGYNIGSTHYPSTGSWSGYYSPSGYYSSFNGWY